MTRQIAIYCKCGGTMKLSVKGTEGAVQTAERKVRAAFRAAHASPECDETDQKTCANARRRNEQ